MRAKSFVDQQMARLPPLEFGVVEFLFQSHLNLESLHCNLASYSVVRTFSSR